MTRKHNLSPIDQITLEKQSTALASALRWACDAVPIPKHRDSVVLTAIVVLLADQIGQFDPKTTRREIADELLAVARRHITVIGVEPLNPESN